MADEEAIKEFGLPADPSHRDTIIKLLKEELVKEEEEEGDQDLIKAFVVQLFSIGSVEDSLLVWEVKATNFDLSIGTDVQFLCGAGIEPTKEYLQTMNSEQAMEALKYLNECIDAGDFDEWTPEKWVKTYRAYYRLESQ